jgi:hypothetical protein
MPLLVPFLMVRPSSCLGPGGLVFPRLPSDNRLLLSHSQTASPLALWCFFCCLHQPLIDISRLGRFSFGLWELPGDRPHQITIIEPGWHVTPSHTSINSQTGPRLRVRPANLPPANSPTVAPALQTCSASRVQHPDRSPSAIPVSRFRYCRSWVICLMPSGPSWSGRVAEWAEKHTSTLPIPTHMQYVATLLRTWLETSSRAWTTKLFCLVPIHNNELKWWPGWCGLHYRLPKLLLFKHPHPFSYRHYTINEP